MIMLVAPEDVLINSRQYLRYQIITLHKMGVENGVIAYFVNLDISTVNRWTERAESDMELELKDKPRPGRPLVYDDALRHRVVAFYCQTTPLPGTGRWTLRWAEKILKITPELVGAETGSMLSRSTIGRILNSQNLKPHRRKYFLQITDPDFFPKMEHLIQVYKTQKNNLFCYDECTGIQVLLRIAPNVHPEMSEKKKKAWLEEFEYIRNGTIDLLAFMDVHNGKVNVECKPDHTKDTFLSVFEQHVAGVRVRDGDSGGDRVQQDERIDYIMDNLASHYSYEFCELVAKLSNVACPDKSHLKTGEMRRKWLQSEEKRIVIHFTPFHGSWLNMIEIWFGILTPKCLKESYASPDLLIQAIYSFAQIWNTLFAHAFNWGYEGIQLHEKVVNRFTKFLYHSSEKLHIKFLTKQMLLMVNMIEQYWDEVPIKDWQILLDLLLDKEMRLRDCIDKDEKPKRKTKAREALDTLLAALSKRLVQQWQLAA
ncbi:MAG: IS630 family transposase [Candidatus Aminicenantes bacterium]|nr:MAG: IS630 family transposase [Candidatus Aminicenantes bacterium]